MSVLRSKRFWALVSAIVAALAAYFVAGCGTVGALGPPAELSSDPFEAFLELSRFEQGRHTCLDMTQQYRDYLHERHGVPYERMRIAAAWNRDLPSFKHAWLEVLWESDGKWHIYDVQLGVTYEGAVYGVLEEEVPSPWSWYGRTYLPGHAVVRTREEGYDSIGDRYVYGSWYSAGEVPARVPRRGRLSEADVVRPGGLR